MESVKERIEHLQELCDSLARSIESVDLELKAVMAERDREAEAAAATRATVEENEFLKTKRTRALATYFKDKGLLITSLQECTPQTLQRYKLAKTIFNAQEALLPVVKFLYQRKGDEYDIAELSATDKTAVCNFLTQLGKMDWIDWSKKKDRISVERKIPKEQYVFFNGGWAEDAARYLIEKTLHDVGIPLKGSYREVKVKDISGTGNVHELDFVVEFKDRVYIFETKTGSLGVERWIDHARMFNNGPNRFLMCCNDDALNAKLFQPYRLFHLASLQHEFGEYVKRAFAVGVKTESAMGTRDRGLG